MNFVLKVIVVLMAGVATIGTFVVAYEAYQDGLSKMVAAAALALVTLYCAFRLTMFLLRSLEKKYSKIATDLYKILVEEPPSTGDTAALGAKELAISPNEFSMYLRKRTITLEAMLYIAATTASRSNTTHLVTAIENLLQPKWVAKGLISDASIEIYDHCWSEVEQLLENRVAWSKVWLDEFYAEPSDYGPCLYQWSIQCRQEFETMVSVIKNCENI
jgi:hypothetical protein